MKEIEYLMKKGIVSERGKDDQFEKVELSFKGSMDNKKILILGLDQVLIHLNPKMTTIMENPGSYYYPQVHTEFILRPNVIEFLLEVREYYNLL